MVKDTLLWKALAWSLDVHTLPDLILIHAAKRSV